MASDLPRWAVCGPSRTRTCNLLFEEMARFRRCAEDRMIPPPAQRFMSERAGSTVTEAAGSHAIYVSQPAAVAALIEQAASAVAMRQ
jgi:hypothetical protein